jgi:hypothetical protein
MTEPNTVVAVFKNHLSVVGKGYHTEWAIGSSFGEARGLLGRALGPAFRRDVHVVPVVGHVAMIGHLAAMMVSALEGALGAALYSSGIPKNSIVGYESALKADGDGAWHSRGDATGQGDPARFNPQSLDLHEIRSSPNP